MKAITSLTLLLALLTAPMSRGQTIIQRSTDGFIAFEAESVLSITNGPPTLWVVTNDATASGTKAIYQAGDNATANSSSFALYSLKFSQPGTYTLYFRWRGDTARTTQDPNGANSFRIPITFGDLDTNVANFAVSSANNSRVPPAANSYGMWEDNITYTVTQAEVDAGTPLIFKIGTREWGMFIDRFVFSTNDALTEAEFNALPNSGASTRPAVVRAVGSGSLSNITITFDKPLGTASTNLSNFSVSGGVSVLNAVIDPDTAKDIILTTTSQTQGSNYTVTLNGVVDTSGNAIAPNSTVRFTAWRLSVGWVTREFYFGVTGGSVANLTAAPKFPDNPDQTDVVKGFQINNQPSGDNYGARLRAFFTPTNSGVYDFFVYTDDEADIFLSTDQSEGNLQFLGTALCCSSTFETGLTVPSPFSLVAGQRYLLQILYKQATGPALLGVAARLQGNPTPPNSLPILAGNLVSTFINPDLGAVTFTQQPTNTTASAGSRARFTVSATSPGGTLFYQWQRNGVDIPGATRATYVTPVLSTSDNGNIYRVMVSVAGNSVSSANAQLTVVPGTAPAIQPYIGINFAGDGSRGMLHSNDVAGVVPQENYNNIIGNTAAAAPLVDRSGAPTTVTLSFDPAASESTGTGEQDADRALLQRYIHNNNTPLTVTLNGVPSGTYNLIVYSVGFNFNTIYHEDISLRGAIDYPTNYVTAQHAGQYQASPGYVRMSSTDPAARQLGNYVQFDNVSPAADGSFTLLLEPQAVAPGINYLPALNAIQLTRTTTVTVQPTLAISRTSNNQIVIAWPASAAGFTLQSTTNLLSSTSWSVVAGSPTPITGAGSITNSPAGPMRFYRLAR